MDPSMPPPPSRNPSPSSSASMPPPPPRNPSSASMPPPPPRNPSPPAPRPEAEPPAAEGEGRADPSPSSSMPPPPPPQPEAGAEGGAAPSPSASVSSAEEAPDSSGASSGDTEMEEAAAPPAERQKQQRPRAPYSIPEWGAAPGHPFFLEVLKDGTIVDQLDVSKKGAYMFGRIDLCDFVLEHPTVSRFHAGPRKEPTCLVRLICVILYWSIQLFLDFMLFCSLEMMRRFSFMILEAHMDLLSIKVRSRRGCTRRFMLEM